RLDYHAGVFSLRTRYRLRLEAVHEDEHRFLSIGSLHSGVGHRTRLYLRQPRSARSHRHGRIGSKVWHCDEPLLLGRGDSGYGLRRHLYDALLLRLTRALGAGISETTI